MRLTFLVVAICANAVLAQIPFLGWCPEYSPMKNFDVDRFLGKWYEAERYFTVAELGTRCVASDYERKPDGNIWVSNQITNAFTGVKRIIDGRLQMTGQPGEGKMLVRYTSLPVPLDTAYSVLATDYDSFAVVYNCNGIGPVHTQSAWVLTRERNAQPPVLQRAYGVLDNYKISRTFFIKTNQQHCAVLPPPQEAIDQQSEEEDPENVRQAEQPQEILKDSIKNKGKEPTKSKYPQKPSKLDYQEDESHDLLLEKPHDEKFQEFLNERPQLQDKPVSDLKPQIALQDKPHAEIEHQEATSDREHIETHIKPTLPVNGKQHGHLEDALPAPAPMYDEQQPAEVQLTHDGKPEDIKDQPEVKKPATLPELIFAAAEKPSKVPLKELHLKEETRAF